MWQDYVIMGGQWVMTFALLPMLFGTGKPSLWTSIPTGIFCFVFAVTFWTLALYWTTVSSAVAGGIWFVLAFQRYNKKKAAA